MENKYIKYALIVLLMVVWGAIIYRVVGGLSGPDRPAPGVSVPMKMDLPESKDTFALFADYPDPFIPEPDSLDIANTKKATTLSISKANPVVTPPPGPETFLRYIGMIGNPGKKLKVAIIIIHGKEMLVKENDRVERISILRIKKASILILYKGEQLTLYRIVSTHT